MSSTPTIQKPKVFSREDLFDLIYAIEERPGIWQKPATYRTRRNLLNEIASKLKCTSSDINKEWNTLRSNYHKERLRVMNAKKKIGVECRSNWEFYDVLHFLCKFNNNITENLQDGSEKDEQPSSLANLFSNCPSKLSPKIDQLTLNNEVHTSRDAKSKSKRVQNSYSENHIDKVLHDTNKIYADFVAQEIQDLNNVAQLKAKMEIQAILNKYAKLKTSKEMGDKDDKKVNETSVCSNAKVNLNGSCGIIIEEKLSTKNKECNLKGILANSSGNKKDDTIFTVNSLEPVEDGFNSLSKSDRMKEKKNIKKLMKILKN